MAFGFGYTIGSGGRAIATLLRTELMPQAVGQDARRIWGLRRDRHCPLGFAGKRDGVPLHVLLGGALDHVPVYNTDVGVGVAVGAALVPGASAVGKRRKERP